MMDRDQLARLMAVSPSMTDRNPGNMGAVISSSQWTPTPTSPWGGLDTFNWKNLPRLGRRMDYQGTDPIGLSAEQLQILRLMGPEYAGQLYGQGGHR